MRYDLAALRDWLVQRLYEHTRVPVVPQNSPGPRPPYPFHAYTVTSPYIVTSQQPAAMVREDIEIDETAWIKYMRYDLPTVVISFSTYSDKMVECWMENELLRSWFVVDGCQDLADEDIVVTEIGAVQDRSTVMADIEQEYRVGFDVRLRLVEERSRTIEPIEQVEWRRVE
ncbi:MAG: hypothetical protein JRD89_02735 [Deltaproteobacteria bacterium]|nr:hypothetical protein [Deltaproteobacteria bacterium]